MEKVRTPRDSKASSQKENKELKIKQFWFKIRFERRHLCCYAILPLRSVFFKCTLPLVSLYSNPSTKGSSRKGIVSTPLLHSTNTHNNFPLAHVFLSVSEWSRIQASCADNPFKEQIEQCFLVAMPTPQLGSDSVIALVFIYFINFLSHRENFSVCAHPFQGLGNRFFSPPRNILKK